MLRRAVSALFPLGRLDRPSRWLVFLMWLVGTLQGFASAHANSTIPFVRSSLGLTEGEMSLILALARLAGAAALVFSWWSDRSGRRRPFLTAYGALLVAAGLTALVTAPWQLATLQAMVRMTATAVGTLAVILLAEQIVPNMRAFAISLYGAGGSFGAGLALIALPIADRGPEAWRMLFALSTVGLVAVPFLRRRISESPVFATDKAIKAPLHELLASRFVRRFWVSGTVNLLTNTFTAMALAFSIERLVDDLGYTTTQSVIISLVGGTAGGLGFFVGGRLSDVLGRRTTSMIALSASVLGGLGVYWLGAAVPLTVAVLISTFGTFAFVPAAASHRTELFPTTFRTTANTAGAYLGMVGSAAGLLFGRFAIDRFGLSETVTILAIPAVIAIALTALLPETRGQDLANVEPDR